MAYKDLETRREHDRKWKKENPEKLREYYNTNRKRILEKQKEYQKTGQGQYADPKKLKEYKRNWYIQYKQKKNPNYKPQAFHDYEAHHQLAMSSGIRTHREWVECYRLGLMPDGIYLDPAASFSRRK